MAASDTWSVGKIAWLMVQIWFGNTYLSFGQASSFHPFFGPILMTGFAALSNTLLITSEFIFCRLWPSDEKSRLSFDFYSIEYIREDWRSKSAIFLVHQFLSIILL